MPTRLFSTTFVTWDSTLPERVQREPFGQNDSLLSGLGHGIIVPLRSIRCHEWHIPN